MATYELTPQYDTCKSFYGKATVTDNGDGALWLHSYGTHVASIHNQKTVLVFGTYSDTTLRHIKEFLKQNGFKADSKAQIEKDYIS